MDYNSFTLYKHFFAKPNGNSSPKTVTMLPHLPVVTKPGSSDGKSIKTIIAGGLAGGIEMMLTYPTEYVKTHLQLDEKGLYYNMHAVMQRSLVDYLRHYVCSILQLLSDRKKYNGIIDCVQKTVNRYGIRGLYYGMSILVYGAIPKVAVRFTVYEHLKAHLSDEDLKLSPGRRFICGLGAGVFEAIAVVTPMETVKVKFIHDQRRKNPVYRGFLHGVATIIQRKGIQGLYRGATATILKQGSNHGIRFFLMETFTDLYKGDNNATKVPKWLVGTFGAAAGIASVLCNGPLDVVKTRMQGLEGSKYRNAWDCAKHIAMYEGYRAFYKGTVMRLIGVCMNVPIIFILYDTFMDVFDKIWPPNEND